MDIINAIAKVRFNSARPQRVQLAKCDGTDCDLLCLEPGQELSAKGPSAYYIITGSGQVKLKSESRDLAMGHSSTAPTANPTPSSTPPSNGSSA